MPNQTTDKVKIYPMGGVGEVGKNMTIVEINDDLFVIDAGLMHPEDDMLGIDIVIPDFYFLIQNRDRIKAIFLTHGHQAHIGSLPYLLKDINAPVYGTKLTIALVEEQLSELHISNKAKLHAINPGQDLKIDQRIISFFRTNHSIPDSIGIAIHTSQGSIVQTGDFKFDFSPVGDTTLDISKMSRIGDRGVLCLLSDSKNAERPGKTRSEAVVAEMLNDTFYFSEGRIFTALHATNIYRIQQVIDAAVANHRKIAIDGYFLERVINISQDLGYLDIPEETLVSHAKIKKLPDREVTVLMSSDQGEPLTPLSKLSNQSHRRYTIKEHDTFIFAASLTPANEKSVTKAIDSILRLGAHVIYGNDVHVSGHASQEELKLMIQLMRPKYFIPVQGEFKMLKAHHDLAVACGIDPYRIFLLDKGEVVEITDGEARQTEKVPAGQVLVDGLGVGDVGNIVLRDRRLLAQDGTLVVVVTLSRRKKEILSGPEIISRGFVYVRESEELIGEATSIVSEVLEQSLNHNISEWSSLKNNIRDSLSRYLYDKTKRRPMILPIIMEI